jgi:3-methyladenine DNA glycosylase AlkD
MNHAHAQEKLRSCASPAKARILKTFFKTGPEQYGAGDIFIGVKVPEIRAVSEMFKDLDVRSILELLHAPIHEERLLALLILIHQYNAGTLSVKRTIVKLYLKNTPYINNWDLVDLTAPRLIGDWLKDKDRTLLDRLARSKHLWERRIAIVATHAFIRDREYNDTLRIADILLHDKEDLIHKATGWMLRETGKRDVQVLKDFLRSRHRLMPRTMLRYAIERFPEKERQGYLQK